MEQLYRASSIFPTVRMAEQKEELEKEPLELDNKYLNLKDGDEQMFHYLENQDRLTRAHLAAQNIIKLYGSNDQPSDRYYGAMANPFYNREDIESIQEPQEIQEEYINDWDNIFLAKTA